MSKWMGSQKIKENYNPEIKTIHEIKHKMKLCRRCGTYWPIEKFHKTSTKYNTLRGEVIVHYRRSECNDCRREKKRQKNV